MNVDEMEERKTRIKKSTGTGDGYRSECYASAANSSHPHTFVRGRRESRDVVVLFRCGVTSLREQSNGKVTV